MRDYTDNLAAVRRRLDEVAGYLKVDELRARRPQLETEASLPDLWDSPEAARKVTGELSVVVEDLVAVMLANSATWRELAVLSLFAVPLVTGWVAIALSLSARPAWLRLSVAALLLLVPPLVLFGVWNA